MCCQILSAFIINEDEDLAADNHGSQLSMTFSSVGLMPVYPGDRCQQVSSAQCPLLILAPLPNSPHASCHSSWIHEIVNSLLEKMIQLSRVLTPAGDQELRISVCLIIFRFCLRVLNLCLSGFYVSSSYSLLFLL